MLDLHMHTTLSDGNLSVEELCSYLEKEKIKLFSITDHNHALAYTNSLPTKIPYITGAELATSHKGRIIEIHGYMIEPKVINEWYEDFYSSQHLEKNENILFDRMKKIVKDNQLQLSDGLEIPEIKKGISKKTIYYDLIKYNEKFKQTFPTYGSFFRQALSDPMSTFFINEGTTYPSVNEVIELIHSANGKAILAHPYEYGFKDTMKELDVLKNNLDGIESFHPSASYREGLNILNYCSEYHLLTSGGSDFHRFEKEIPIGIRLFEDLYDKKPFHWLHNYISKDDFK